jgi:diaminopimelate decarboxylase
VLAGLRIGRFLALGREIAEPRAGDLLAVMSAGAYGAVQAGIYDSRALVPEVLVRESEWAAGAAGGLRLMS